MENIVHHGSVVQAKKTHTLVIDNKKIHHFPQKETVFYRR